MANKIGIDRRIQKTKKALTEALIHLILEKGYEKVTVQDILDKANVGRSTFYLHYESKEQLMFDGHNNINASNLNIVKNNKIDFSDFIENIGQSNRIAKAILGNKSGQMIALFYKKKIANQVREFYSSEFSKTKSDQRLLRYYSSTAASAIMSLIVEWIEDDMPFSTNELTLFSEKIVENIMIIDIKDK